MILIEIETRNFDKQTSKLANYDKLSKRHFSRAMGKSIVVLLSAWKRDAPILSGDYYKSIAGQIVAGRTGTEIQGIVGTNITSRGFPYPAALEKSAKYHYRTGPRAGLRTQGRVKRIVKKNTRRVNNFFRDAAKQLVKALEV